MTVPSCCFPITHSTKRGRDQASIARRFDAALV
jgi:hypothetical protein